jgi:hypothetical protein
MLYTTKGGCKVEQDWKPEKLREARKRVEDGLVSTLIASSGQQEGAGLEAGEAAGRSRMNGRAC